MAELLEAPLWPILAPVFALATSLVLATVYFRTRGRRKRRLRRQLRMQESGYVPAQKRIKPTSRQANGAFLAIAVALMLFGLLGLFSEPGYKSIGVLLVVGGGIWLIRQVNELMNPKSASNQFRFSNARVEGTITDHQIIEFEDNYGLKSYKYYVTVVFEPSEWGICKIVALVSRAFFEAHDTGTTLQIYYCRSNPVIALLQGEYLSSYWE